MSDLFKYGSPGWIVGFEYIVTASAESGRPINTTFAHGEDLRFS